MALHMSGSRRNGAGYVKLLSNSTGGMAILIGGLIATILATIIVTRVTMKALGDAFDEDLEAA